MEPSSRQPQFGDADYNLAAFGREVCGGRLRWFATVLAALSAILLIGVFAGLLPADLQLPVNVTGGTAKVIVFCVLVFWSMLAVINWRAHRRNRGGGAAG